MSVWFFCDILVVFVHMYRIYINASTLYTQNTLHKCHATLAPNPLLYLWPLTLLFCEFYVRGVSTETNPLAHTSRAYLLPCKCILTNVCIPMQLLRFCCVYLGAFALVCAAYFPLCLMRMNMCARSECLCYLEGRFSAYPWLRGPCLQNTELQ
jgi:hypothetical protein